MATRKELLNLDPGTDAAIVDSYKYAASVVSHVVSGGYLRMVKTIPQMYRFIYDRAERATEVGPFRAWAHQFTAANLRPLIRSARPDIVVCTHAFPCGAMAEYKRRFADCPPVFGIVTDFVVHAFWIHRNVEGYAVASEQMRAALVQRGVPTNRVHPCGIPIDAAFGTRPDRKTLRERLELPADRRAVLLMGGGLGIGPLERMMEALDAVDVPLCAVVIVGRSAQSQRRVLDYAQRVSYPVRVLGFVSNVHQYMHAADVLVTKPGGLTSAEALSAQVPLVLFKPLPGQEERNTAYLVERGAAVRAKDLKELTAAVGSSLADNKLRDRMRYAMGTLSRPDAAARIAAAIARTASGVREESIA